MRFDPHDVVLVVGHSLFLQQMVRRCASPRLENVAPELTRQLKESKLQNCGCLGLDMEFDEEDGEPSIIDAKLMFLTRCVSK